MKQQVYFYLGVLLLLPLFPVLFVLGKRVRRRIPVLPEAQHHLVGTTTGRQPAFHLLTLGESTIAGVGVTDHTEGLTGQLAQTLALATGRAISWQVLARSGYTTQRVATKLVPRIPPVPFHCIVVGVGGNDTFTLRSPLGFRRAMHHLLGGLRQLQPEAKIVIANMPPVGEFPAFPKLMRVVLGALIRLHGAVIRDVPTQFTGVYYMDKPVRFQEWVLRTNTTLPLQINDFFSDGVHPSPLTYAMWGQEIGDFIVERQLIGLAL